MKRWAPTELATFLGATSPATTAVDVVDVGELPPRVREALTAPVLKSDGAVDRSATTMRVVGACFDAGRSLDETRTIVRMRSDLAARLDARNDDDVVTCWLKATDDRQQRRLNDYDPVPLIAPATTKAPAAETVTPDGSRGGSAGPELEVIMACDVIERRVIYLWDGRIPIGAATLLPGEEGIGKTLVGIRIMSDLTNGTLPGEFYGTPRNVIVMAPEDGIEDVFRPRLREAGADLTRVAFITSRKVGEDPDSVVVPRDLPLLSRVVRKLDAPLLWIDSLVTSLPTELKSIAYKEVATVLTRIGTWASEERLAVAAPWHLNKNSSGDPALRMMDSRAFRTAVRSLLMVVADPDAPEGAAQGVVVLDKANAGTLAVAALRYRIRSATFSIAEPDEITGDIVEKPTSCGVADWIGTVTGDGRAFVRDALAPKIEKAGSARQWLRDYLTEHGEVPRTEVIAAAAAAGHSAEAMKRAARGLIHSEDLTGQHVVDGRRRPFKHAIWSLQDGRSVPTHPTDPTDPTRETSIDPFVPACAGQLQSGQSGRSGQSHSNDPTGDVEGTNRTRALHTLTRDEIAEQGAQIRLRIMGTTEERTTEHE